MLKLMAEIYLALKFDTGMEETLLIESNWKKIASPALVLSKLKLKSYSRHSITVLHFAKGSVGIPGGKPVQLKFYIINDVKNSLFG